MLISGIEQDGFTLCVIDQRGTYHCFRVDPAIGKELIEAVEAYIAEQSA